MVGNARFVRYLVNGLVAAGVHFTLLYCNLKLLHLPSAGLSNLLAAIGGTGVSFLGNRYFVFRAQHHSIFGQAGRFGLLYALTSLMHGVVLFGWTDLARQDYRVGFLIATGLQLVLSYLGNRHLVFRP